jgi:hypothetical protein
MSFAQQAWPAAPHCAQVPFMSQPSPPEHESPAQQGCPAAPHWPQTWSAVQLIAVHEFPAQQG